MLYQWYLSRYQLSGLVSIVGQALFTFCKQSFTCQVVALHAKELLRILLCGIT